MSEDPRRDLSAGVPIQQLAEGHVIPGRVGDQNVILLRSGDAVYAVGAQCTHYSTELATGLVVGETLRCPLHHACFDLRTGLALRAPALDPLPCWRVEQIAGVAYVRDRLHVPADVIRPPQSPRAIVIVGGGAAGLAAAVTLRAEGYAGRLTLVSADSDPPVDRPNLSKDYLAGNASEDWMPLRPASFYTEHRIELLLATTVTSLDLPQRQVTLQDGSSLAFDRLLLATGAAAVRLDVPGAAPSQVHVLRSFADTRAIIAAAASARRAVVVGASFIGLEVAASLRERGLEVHVVGREAVPMERVLGAEVGRFVRSLHEAHGVVFHLEARLERVDGQVAVISDGARVEADLIVMGVGVRPALALAENAGLAMDRGVKVDAHLQTSAPGVYAAGDIARWPDPRSGEGLRVEHWVVAERQGQVAALNMLGRPQTFDAVPFFWSQHYDVAINYVGHAETWDSIDVAGSLADHDCTLTYNRGGQTLAVVTIGRDLASLQAELAMEKAR
jgi:NADPH-dependent 2,4-dienoyl-CoA reductase/sulfur reductase-like enzyme/nitrite reductase/ring-hydroxylating ferredoxin subunit